MRLLDLAEHVGRRGRFGCGRGVGVVASTGCSSFGLGSGLKSYYPGRVLLLSDPIDMPFKVRG